MPLIPEDIKVPLTEGVDTYSDPKQSRLLGVCKNMYVERGGELTTRPGLEEWSTTERTQGNERNYSTILEAGTALTEFNGKPLLVGRDGYYRTVNYISAVPDATAGCGVFVPAADGHYNIPWAVIGEGRHFAMTHGHAPVPCGQDDVFQLSHYAVSGDYEIFVYPNNSVTNTWQYAIRNTVTKAWTFIHDGSVFSGSAFNEVYGVLAVDYDATPANGERFLIVVANAAAAALLVSIVPSTGVATSTTISNFTPGATGSVCAATEGSQNVALICGGNTTSGNIRLIKAQGDLTSFARDETTGVWSGSGDKMVAVSQGDGAYIFVFVWKNGPLAGDLYAFPVDYGAAEPAIDSKTSVFNVWNNDHRPGCMIAAQHQVLGVPDISGGGTHSIRIILGIAGGGATTQLEMITHICEASFDARLPTKTLNIINNSPRILRNMLPAAQPIISDQKILLPVTFQGSNPSQIATQYIHNSLHLMELRRPDDAAASDTVCHHTAVLRGYDVARTLVDDSDPLTGGLPLSVFDGSVISVPYLKQIKLNPSQIPAEPVWQQAIASVVHATEDTVPPQFVRSGSDLIMGGGIIRHIDGACQELGFWEPMEIFDLSWGGTGALNGDYSVRQVAEWVDQFGQQHTSAPSDIKTVTGVVNGSNMTVDVVDPNHYQCAGVYDTSSAKFGGVDLTLFRTQGGESLHQRWENAGKPDDGLALGYISLVSVLVDADTANQESLYTDAGILQNDPPPSGNILLAHKNRVFVVPFERPDTLWPSKQRASGVGLSFNRDSVMTIFDGGDITGLAALDDYVVVFKESAIYLFGGEGPTTTGVGGFSTPQRISSSVGCQDSNSVASFDGGVLFKSKVGWYLLDRSLALTPIGLPVKDWDAHTVYRAILLPSLRQIRVVHDPDDTHDVLVFDYLNQAWTVINYDDTQGASFGPVDMAEVAGEVMVLGSDGRSFREIVADLYDDDEEQIFEAKVTTPWVSNELMDIQRIWKIKFVGVWGDDDGDGTVYVKVYHDFSDTESETWNIECSSIGDDGVFWIKPERAICKALRIEVSGYIRRISAITLKAGKRPGRVGRTPALTVEEG